MYLCIDNLLASRSLLRGETLKKLIILTIIMLTSATAMGCIDKNILPPANGPTYSPPVASIQPTVQVTENPSVSPKLIEVPTYSPPYQYMPNQARVSHPRYFRTEDWEMPVPAPGSLKPAHHGIINEMEFWNPLDHSVNISVYNLKTAFYEKRDIPSKFMTSYEMFYDDRRGFFSQLTLAPGEHRTVLMYSYIMDDALYEKYRGYINEPVSVSLIPDVPYS